MRTKRKKLLLCMTVMLVLLLGMSVGATTNQNNKGSTNIAQYLKKNNKEYSILLQALDAAGLTETLQGEGPFTLFAPNNRAFEQLPKGALEKLLKPENKAQLTDILTYHVAKGKLPASEVLKLNNKELTMLNGKPAKIEVKGDEVYIDGARILRTDIETSNGVIHIIDTVLMP